MDDSLHGWEGAEEGKISSSTPNDTQFKSYELFTSIIFHLIFLDHG
jgi:hypothetical protein